MLSLTCRLFREEQTLFLLSKPIGCGGGLFEFGGGHAGGFSEKVKKMIVATKTNCVGNICKRKVLVQHGIRRVINAKALDVSKNGHANLAFKQRTQVADA